MLRIKKINNWNDYTIDTNGNIYSERKQKYLKQTINKHGYCKVTLQKDKNRKLFSVHRLVAQTFIPNSNQYPCINHKDNNKQNNNIKNLEWCTYQYNTQYAVLSGQFDNMRELARTRAIKNNLGKNYIYANESRKKPVMQFDKFNNLVNKFDSMTIASKETGISIMSISYSANNIRKTGGGFIWHFV